MALWRKYWKHWQTASLLFGLGVLSPLSAPAQDGVAAPPPAALVDATPPTPSWDDFRALAERLEAAESRLQELKDIEYAITRLPTEADPPSTAPNAPAGQLGLAEEHFVNLDSNLQAAAPAGPTFPTVRLSGFFHLDTGYFSQDANNRTTLGDIQDGTGFRRARLQAIGSVAEFTNYSIEFDFATAGRPSFMDVWGEQTHVPFFGNIRIGQYRQPFSMDALTSIKQLEFLERSLPFQAFVPFRRVGMMAYDKSENEMTAWAYGVFRTGGFLDAPVGDSRFATDIGDNGGYSFSSRVTHLLYYDEPAEGRYLLHAGASYDYSRLTGHGDGITGDTYDARVIPEFFVGDPAGAGLTAAGTPFFVDTGRIPAKGFNMFGLEAAGQYGPAHFQAEYMGTLVDQTNGPSLYYDGAYIQGGYFLTGENRTYNRTVGAFDRVTPFTEFFSLGRKSAFCG
ncbi:MAG: porin, partial [Pirellulales bacterium]